MKKKLLYLLGILAFFSVVILGLFLIENIAGKNRWNECERLLQEEGIFEQTDAPKEIEDKDNFCAHPLVAAILKCHKKIENQDEITYEFPDLAKRFQTLRLPEKGNSRLPNWQGQHDPILVDEEKIPAFINERLDVFNEIAEAATRNEAFFLFPEGLAILEYPTTPLIDIMNASRFAALVHAFAIDSGDIPLARKAVRVGFALLRTSFCFKTWAGSLVSMTCIEIIGTSHWYALKMRFWESEDLEWIGSEFRSIETEMISAFIESCKGEIRYASEAFDYVKNGGDPAIAINFFLKDSLRTKYIDLIPNGWIDQSKANVCEIILNSVYLPARNGAYGCLVTPDEFSWRTNLFSWEYLNFFSEINVTFLKTKFLLRAIQSSCQLEKQFLISKSYPGNFEMPEDPITLNPLNYRLSNRRYEISSIGWDWVDNSGEIVFKPNQDYVDFTKGDWVWKYE